MLPFLERRNGESTDELLAYEGRYRTDSIVLAFEAALEAKRTRNAALTPEERVVLAVEAVEREVHNGGFHQFFVSSSCEHASIAASAFGGSGAKTAPSSSNAHSRPPRSMSRTSGTTRWMPVTKSSTALRGRSPIGCSPS